MNAFSATLLTVAFLGIRHRDGGSAVCFSALKSWPTASGLGWPRPAEYSGSSPSAAPWLTAPRPPASRWFSFLPCSVRAIQPSHRRTGLLLRPGRLAARVALSIYSLGYVRGYYGRKNVGVLGALFNALLLATTLVFLADNVFFFLMTWEIMALTAYCLVSFEHEHEETRNAGVCFTS